MHNLIMFVLQLLIVQILLQRHTNFPFHSPVSHSLSHVHTVQCVSCLLCVCHLMAFVAQDCGCGLAGSSGSLQSGCQDAHGFGHIQFLQTAGLRAWFVTKRKRGACPQLLEAIPPTPCHMSSPALVLASSKPAGKPETASVQLHTSLHCCSILSAKNKK